jgi:hypothetical protein
MSIKIVPFIESIIKAIVYDSDELSLDRVDLNETYHFTISIQPQIKTAFKRLVNLVVEIKRTGLITGEKSFSESENTFHLPVQFSNCLVRFHIVQLIFILGFYHKCMMYNALHRFS